MTNIKFNMYNVTDKERGLKVRVSYCTGTIFKGNKKFVAVYAKEYGSVLGEMFADVENNTDMMTDYFEKDRVRILEDDPRYPAALEAATRKRKS